MMPSRAALREGGREQPPQDRSPSDVKPYWHLALRHRLPGALGPDSHSQTCAFGQAE